MIVTRFAPSPTGFLHIGGLRTALFSYLWARKNGGKFLLRIEDTDQARNSEAAVKTILKAFEWVGMDYDDVIEYQSRRFNIYAAYVKKLLDSGKAYYCYMSKEELDALREEQIKRGERPRYDGRYRNLPPKEGIKPVVRIKSPTSGKITIEDGIKGAVSFEWSETVDDFIIARSDGTPTYNFVVAIDDALMGVTDVIRGDDHLSNTPKQIVVYNALGFAVPNFFHVPMILNGEGKKLSKRDGATDVMEYRKMGYLPEALLNFLARLGWSHGDQEIFSRKELLKFFDPRSINKSASAYNASKLLWINSEYIKQKRDQEMIALLKEDFSLDAGGFKNAAQLFSLCKEKARTLLDFASETRKFLFRPESYNEKDTAAISADEIVICERFLEFARGREEFHKAIEEFLQANNLKMPQLAKPMRTALFGAAQGPALAESLAILGVEEAKERVAALKSRICRG
jgi:glutamyl-tRNA synthetase